MTIEGVDWQALAFFSFNAAFTAFNARIAWMNWMRQEATKHPRVEAEIHYHRGDMVRLNLLYLPVDSIVWVPIKARLIRPGSGMLVNPLQHQSISSDNEPWLPGPIEVDWSNMPREARLLDRSLPGREELWVKLSADKWPRVVVVEIDLESTEPQPRRYKTKVTRVIPAFVASIST